MLGDKRSKQGRNYEVFGAPEIWKRLVIMAPRRVRGPAKSCVDGGREQGAAATAEQTAATKIDRVAAT
jgi:hypothetical protein